MKSQTYEKHFPKLSAEQLAENSTKKVICGMSGGVDSSASAFILQQQGYQVEGLFMKNWEEDDDTDYCTAAADLADAQYYITWNTDRISETAEVPELE